MKNSCYFLYRSIFINEKSLIVNYILCNISQAEQLATEYKIRAKRCHPDRFQTEEEKSQGHRSLS